jgi:hypothetical protein
MLAILPPTGGPAPTGAKAQNAQLLTPLAFWLDLRGLV